MMSLILIVIVAGVVFPRGSCAGIEYKNFHFSPQNQSDVSAQRREPFTAAMLSVGKVLVPIWKSIQKKTSIKVELTNRLNSGQELRNPQWYSLHGHASVLPPPAIGNGEVMDLQFEKTVGGNQGAEGALAYAIGQVNDKSSLIIMWRVPQFGIYEDISFYTKIENKKEVNRAYLEQLFKNTPWIKAKDRHDYNTETNAGFTVNAATGTQNEVTLRVSISTT